MSCQHCLFHPEGCAFVWRTISASPARSWLFSAGRSTGEDEAASGGALGLCLCRTAAPPVLATGGLMCWREGKKAQTLLDALSSHWPPPDRSTLLISAGQASKHLSWGPEQPSPPAAPPARGTGLGLAAIKAPVGRWGRLEAWNSCGPAAEPRGPALFSSLERSPWAEGGSGCRPGQCTVEESEARGPCSSDAACSLAALLTPRCSQWHPCQGPSCPLSATKRWQLSRHRARRALGKPR